MQQASPRLPKFSPSAAALAPGCAGGPKLRSSQSRQTRLLRREPYHLVPELRFLEAMITSPTCQLISLGNVARHVYGGWSRRRAARRQCHRGESSRRASGRGARGWAIPHSTRRTPAVRNKKEKKKNQSLPKREHSERQMSDAVMHMYVADTSTHTDTTPNKGP